MSTLEQFRKQQYLNLETFRRSGEGVKTPVWFAQDGEVLYVVTGADSGKVKRIRRNGRVNVAACKMDGRLIGSWVPAQARPVDDPQVHLLADRLLNKKYGLIKKFLDLQRGRNAPPEAILEIRLAE
jgi:hypothetical protein